jgi:type I restriction enzyme S subunit
MSDVLIPDGWTQVKLGDVCVLNPSVPLKRGSHYNYVDMASIDVALRYSPILRNREFGGGGSRFQQGDTLMARITPCLENGKIAQVHSDPEAPYGFGSTEFIVLRSILGITDSNYIYYLVKGPDLRNHAVSNMSGTSGRQRVPTEAMRILDILLPPLHEQKAIAHILGSLDDKIDQLRKTNSVLEDMASALFKSWFVDFDPVNAKQENISTGLSPELDALFPDSFEDSSLGPIPKGWRVVGLASTGEFLNGLALQKYPGDVLPVIKIPQLRQNSSEGADRCSNGVAPQYVIDDGDLLFSWSGTLVAGWWTAGKGALNQHLFKVSSGELSTVMLKHWIDHHLPWFKLVASSKAVTMGHIKRGHLDEAKVVIPEPTFKDYADSILADYRDKYITNGKQIRTLTNLRDTLLPTLISGELRVPEAEEMVAELGL